MELFSLLQEGKSMAFDEIYERYWSKLYAYAYNRLRDKETCEEIIQEVFVSLWANRKTTKIESSVSGYLYQAVKFQMLNFMKSAEVRNNYLAQFSHFRDQLFDDSNNESIAFNELRMMLEKSMSDLPEKCQEVFRMSRVQHLSIQEIAQQLNISHKTVENHLTKALKHLREDLGDFLILMVVLGLMR
ncbi:RNA polymerase sigma-70 factor [Flectobacillus rhizosphaerae]|uniref:RNA polymerase sigma-70 factor n=1 Tax=Flectobacillus roseus TaxID=502259 RepID=A0ABT6YEF4_9BACT|nr:RNA polymerase sigma-70 factor [Flectobacillus roseus]